MLVHFIVVVYYRLMEVHTLTLTPPDPPLYTRSGGEVSGTLGEYKLSKRGVKTDIQRCKHLPHVDSEGQ